LPNSNGTNAHAAKPVQLFLDPNPGTPGVNDGASSSYLGKLRRSRKDQDPHLSLRVGDAGAPTEAHKVSLHVNIHRVRNNKGVDRYETMTKPFLPLRYNQDGPDIHHIRFTSPPLRADAEITGFPIAKLWISSSKNDASLVVYLQIVDPSGRSYYISEGILRASSRKLADNGTSADVDTTMKYPGMPLHSYLKADAAFLEPSVPVLCEFPLMPISYMAKKGQRIRLSVSGGDPINYTPLSFSDGASHYDLTVHVGADYPSSLLIPCVGTKGVDVFASEDVASTTTDVAEAAEEGRL